MNDKMPKIIYLQGHTDECSDECSCEITWCEDKINDSDTAYIQIGAYLREIESLLNSFKKTIDMFLGVEDE